MPGNKLIAQIEDELVHSQASLAFWRDQATLLAHTDFQVTAKRQVMHREAEIKRLLEAKEALLEMRHA